MGAMRIERDGMGEVAVPQEAYYGAQTERARRNFEGISGRRFGRAFLAALGLVKRAAAEVNGELGRLDPERARAIAAAAAEVEHGAFDGEFVVDVFQTGSGTSTNMNANEVIAARANEILGCRFEVQDPRRVHPNDHVNLGQSSNDVFPTAAHVAVAGAIRDALVPALERLESALRAQAARHVDVVKLGRTHLQDAVPLTFGQVFGGWALQVRRGRERVEATLPHLCELPLGGTAVGTGLNTHPEFAGRAAALIAEATGLPFVEAPDHFEAQGARDALVASSGALRGLAVALLKIANDVRLLGSGPRAGLGELRLPAVQPGSSIMPGKVNPVIAESLAMVCAQVMGLDVAAGIAGQGGALELNTMMPLLAVDLLDMTAMLGAAAGRFAALCIEGLEVDAERAAALVERSLALVTALVPAIGYDRAAAIAKEAWAAGRPLREVAASRSGLSEAEIDALLDPRRMLGPQG